MSCTPQTNQQLKPLSPPNPSISLNLPSCSPPVGKQVHSLLPAILRVCPRSQFLSHNTHTHTHTPPTRTCTHTHTMHAHAFTHIHTHAHTHGHTHAHTHTHAHAHTQARDGNPIEYSSKSYSPAVILLPPLSTHIRSKSCPESQQREVK